MLFGYYLVPATVIAVIWCARNGRPIAMRALTASFLCAFCLPHTFPQPVFFTMLAFGLAYVCGPMVDDLATARKGPRRDTSPSRETRAGIAPRLASPVVTGPTSS